MLPPLCFVHNMRIDSMTVCFLYDHIGCLLDRCMPGIDTFLPNIDSAV